MAGFESCQFESQIDAYYDGELDAVSRERIEQHLAACPACTARLANLQAISGLIEQSSAPRLSQMSVARLNLHIESLLKENSAERELLRFARWFGAVAASVMVAGSVWLMTKTETSAKAAMTVTPPWVEAVAAADPDPAVREAATPVAQWYLASASTRNDEAREW